MPSIVRYKFLYVVHMRWMLAGKEVVNDGEMRKPQIGAP